MFARRRDAMVITKPTLREREKELQTLLPTADGLHALNNLAKRYEDESGNKFWPGTSLITFILLHERDHDMIAS